ncbi:metallophosphoesterase, partial [bacterium]|nr:metallophosphoesterase [candidate division CSSED10-310 bacterium]
MNLNHQYPFRIAHLTDLHVAATWQPVLEAAALVAAGIPVMGSAVLALRETVQSLPPEAHLPVKLALGAVGLVGGAWMASQSRKARSMAKCVLAMLYQYNHSGTHRRRKLFRSLRENRVDHLMITGDLTVTSHPAEYCKVCEELALYGFDRDNMTVLPGNHDRVRFPLSARFEDFFSEVRFPDVREIVPGIIVTAVDSNVPDADWTLWDTITANTRGFIDPGQIRSLARKLDGVTDETVIAGVHHLPARRRSARLIPEPLKRTYMDE